MILSPTKPSWVGIAHDALQRRWLLQARQGPDWVASYPKEIEEGEVCTQPYPCAKASGQTILGRQQQSFRHLYYFPLAAWLLQEISVKAFEVFSLTLHEVPAALSCCWWQFGQLKIAGGPAQLKGVFAGWFVDVMALIKFLGSLQCPHDASRIARAVVVLPWWSLTRV